MASTKLVSLIPIRDMNRAIKFYTKNLGGRLVMRGQGDMKDGWAALKVSGADVWFVDPGRREKRALAYHTFLVGNIKSYVRRLQKNGVKFDKATKMGPKSRLDGPIAWEAWGASAFFKDSEGNLLMVWQDTVGM